MPSFEYPHGHIARAVEKKAGKEFGPKKLKKEMVASAFNLSPDEITDEEWEEISEFAVNAGSDLIRSAIRKDVQGAISLGNIVSLQERIKNNEDGLFPIHDIFHAAETYRLTGGRSASANFIETDIRGRYTDPQAAAAELYPVLFLIVSPESKSPLPIFLTSAEGRKIVAQFLGDVLDSSAPAVQEMIRTLSTTPPPDLPSLRKKEYESLLEVIVVSNAEKRLRDMGPEVAPLSMQEKQAMREAMKRATEHPASHYQEFAEKVFSQDGLEKNPRLFLDEFLASIRSFKASENSA